MAGSIVVISATCSSTKGRYHTRRRNNRNDGRTVRDFHRRLSQTYRDRKDLALLAAQILKSRNPNSAVKLKDLQTGEEIVVAFKAAQ
jgi:hypothetical protein